MYLFSEERNSIIPSQAMPSGIKRVITLNTILNKIVYTCQLSIKYIRQRGLIPVCPREKACVNNTVHKLIDFMLYCRKMCDLRSITLMWPVISASHTIQRVLIFFFFILSL